MQITEDIHTNSLSAERILILSGIACLLLAMALGFVYANKLSHVANSGIKDAWAGVMTAVSAGDLAAVKQDFATITDLTAKRGRIMNSHSHLGASGLLALLLALLLPLTCLSERTRNFLAWGILVGALL